MKWIRDDAPAQALQGRQHRAPQVRRGGVAVQQRDRPARHRASGGPGPVRSAWPHATVPQPFSLLVGVGIEAARSRTWRQRDALMTAVGVRRPVQRGDRSAAEVAAQGISRPVTAWDAHRLGVHRAITTDAVGGQVLPELTVYVQRAHDARLGELLAAPARPLMMVLVGGSSTGKTRAAFEAVRVPRLAHCHTVRVWTLRHEQDMHALERGPGTRREEVRV